MKIDSSVIDLAERQAALCRIFGNSRRLLILWLLSKGELSVHEIASCAGSTLQNVSQHLNLLKKAGIVTARRDGQTIYYRAVNYEWIKHCLAVLQIPDIPV